MRDSKLRRLGTGAALLALAGCSGGLTLPTAGNGSFPVTAGVTGYGAANGFFTLGYSDTELSPGVYRVRAKGSAATPSARLEKIAAARAAEIGVEQNLKFFKPGPFSQTFICKEAQEFVHGKKGAERNPLVETEVTYSKVQTDATYLPSADTFSRLSAELASDVPDGDAMAQAVNAVAAGCGK